LFGFRGMREHEISFKNMVVPATSLLDKEEGNGFKQLVAIFETAQI